MVPKATAPRRRRLHGCLRCFAGLAIALWVIALSAPLEASADPYTPPVVGSTEPDLPTTAACAAAPESSESEDPVVQELRQLRIAEAVSCARSAELAETIAHRQWWIVAELIKVREGQSSLATSAGLLNVDQALTQLHDDLTVAGGLGVSIAGQANPLDVTAPAGVEVTNPTEVEGVQAAVVEGTETANQNLWAILGVLVGFGVLVWFFRMVRP